MRKRKKEEEGVKEVKEDKINEIKEDEEDDEPRTTSSSSSLSSSSSVHPEEEETYGFLTYVDDVGLVEIKDRIIVKDKKDDVQVDPKEENKEREG